MITLIAAVDLYWGLGKANTIPWNNPEDTKFFKDITKDSVVIMGSRTWESLGCRPLKHRKNIVVTSKVSKYAPAADTVFLGSIEEALERAKEDPTKEIFGIGGAGIYEALAPHADRVLITRILGDFDCDVKFPLDSISHYHSVKLFKQLDVDTFVFEYLLKQNGE